VKAIADMARYIPAPLLNEVLDVLQKYPYGINHAHALGTVALHLPAPLDQKVLDLAFAADRGVVARRAILTEAKSLWQEGITVAELEIFRRTLDGLGLDGCFNTLASALDVVSQIGGTQALDDCLQNVRAVQRWWPPSIAENERRTGVSPARADEVLQHGSTQAL